jgi:hypothetical protein
MKRFFVIPALAIALLATPPSHALTPSERKLVQDAQAQLRAGAAEYKAADARAAEAEQHATEAGQRAAAAEQTAVDLGKSVTVLQGQVKDFADKADAIAKERDKYKSVYDECTKNWGLGAIFYGIKDLTKHIFITIIVLVVLAVGIWILSIAVPVTGPFIALGLRAIGGVFALVGRGVSATFGALHSLLVRVLTPKPAPPPLTPPAPPPIKPIGS